MRPVLLAYVVVPLAALALAGDAPAEVVAPTPVVVTVVGRGQIRVVVSEGATRPCDGSGSVTLFRGRASAGDVLRLESRTGSVCVDHTYGALRQTQWAGAAVWSGSGAGLTGVRDLRGTISTEEP